ncbi:MAG: DNA-3-methyladenine glycosylase [Thermoleophilia bacterium]|nr:DNA-3-methyladenine glycosylase [Thermoleophilia bacterium]
MLEPLRHPADVAPDLLGWTIACRGTAAVLTEVEAYHEEEPAAHSYGGRVTPRTAGLFGPPGTAYVYLSYGIHWCANLVTGADGSGEAVLLRAGMPVHGEELIRARRVVGRATEPGALRAKDLLTGPGRLAQGLDLRLDDTGCVLLREDLQSLGDALDAAAHGPVIYRDIALAAQVGIELPLDRAHLLVGPRIGITKAVELPWRFGVRGAHVSKPFPVEPAP